VVFSDVVFSPPHGLLDCRQQYFNTNHFCVAADDGAPQSLIDHDCACLHCISNSNKGK